jgi:hypothetical protein
MNFCVVSLVGLAIANVLSATVDGCQIRIQVEISGIVLDFILYHPALLEEVSYVEFVQLGNMS